MPRLLFEKTGNSVWISHLDLMRVFQRAFRRAGFLLKHSQGFTPRAIVSIALPLSVGVESNCELLDYELENNDTVTCDRLNEVLPEGIRVLGVMESGRKIKELTRLRAEIVLYYDHGVSQVEVDQMNALFDRDELVLEKHSRKGKTETNIRPMILKMSTKLVDEGTIKIDVEVCAQNPSLNPQMLVSAIELYAPEVKPDHAVVKRLEVYDSEGNVFR